MEMVWNQQKLLVNVADAKAEPGFPSLVIGHMAYVCHLPTDILYCDIIGAYIGHIWPFGCSSFWPDDVFDKIRVSFSSGQKQ